MEKLPTDVQHNIFSFMSNADVVRTSCVSKTVQEDVRAYFDRIRGRLCCLVGDAIFNSDVWKLWVFSITRLDHIIETDARLNDKQKHSIKRILHEDFKGEFNNPSCVSITLWYTLRVQSIKPFRVFSIVLNNDMGAIRVHALQNDMCAITYTRVPCNKEVLLAVYNKNNGMFWPTDQLNHKTCVQAAYALHGNRDCSVTGPTEFSRLFGAFAAHIRRHRFHNSSNTV